jgi:hypothetical protein
LLSAASCGKIVKKVLLLARNFRTDCAVYLVESYRSILGCNVLFSLYQQPLGVKFVVPTKRELCSASELHLGGFIDFMEGCFGHRAAHSQNSHRNCTILVRRVGVMSFLACLDNPEWVVA